MEVAREAARPDYISLQYLQVRLCDSAPSAPASREYFDARRALECIVHRYRNPSASLSFRLMVTHARILHQSLRSLLAKNILFRATPGYAIRHHNFKIPKPTLIANMAAITDPASQSTATMKLENVGCFEYA